MEAVIKYVHAISPCARDLEGPFEISAVDLSTVKKARAWLRKHKATGLGLSKDARRTDCGGWVFFPPRGTLNRTGSVHWSISIRLDVGEVQEKAATCTCRNHPIQAWNQKGANQ